jgi:hypothetical protein
VFVPLPRGDHLVQIERSFLNRVKDGATLALMLACKGKQSIIEFCIFHPDPELEQLERRRLTGLARAVGVEQLEESDQLHGRAFRMTIWRSKPLRFSCRPVTDARSIQDEEVASGQGMHPLAHSIILGGYQDDGDSDGPNAA